jgi:hypothetical protein
MRTSRGGSPRRLNAQARIASRTAPKDLVNVLAEPIIHRPHTVPAHGGERDFGYWSRKMGAMPAAPLRYIGFRPPIQAPIVDCAPGSAPDRVDVSNRYLGNKVCEYDTSLVPPARGRGRDHRHWTEGRPGGATKRLSIAQQLESPTKLPARGMASLRLVAQRQLRRPQVAGLVGERRPETNIDFSCSSHITWEHDSAWFSLTGVNFRQKKFLRLFLYGKPADPYGHHQNHKPGFAELADLAKSANPANI